MSAPTPHPTNEVKTASQTDLSARLRSLALSTPREPLLTREIDLGILRAFLTGEALGAGAQVLREAGYLDEAGEATESGEWLRTVTGGSEAVSLSLKWQHRDGLRELQMWLDEDLVLLVDTRAAHGAEEPDALIGYASYLDLPHVLARWLRLAPGEVSPAPDREVTIDELRQLFTGHESAGLGSLSANGTPLLDFAHDGERNLLLLPPEQPGAVRVTLASVTSWNLLLLLTAAATQPGDDAQL